MGEKAPKKGRTITHEYFRYDDMLKLIQRLEDIEALEYTLVPLKYLINLTVECGQRECGKEMASARRV